MLEIARKIGKNFDYIRVDLYFCNNKIYFGELTFAHGSGFERFSDYSYDVLLGNMWVGK